jgi:hypothetical protein
MLPWNVEDVGELEQALRAEPGHREEEASSTSQAVRFAAEGGHRMS